MNFEKNIDDRLDAMEAAENADDVKFLVAAVRYWKRRVAEEREACAVVAEDWVDPQIPTDDGGTGCIVAFSEGQDCSAPDGIAAAIRDRSNHNE